MFLLLVYFFTALGVSFLCSLMEAVLLSVRRSHIALLLRNGRRSGQIWERLRKRIDHPLAAILTLNTVANVVGASGVGAQVARLTGNDNQMLALASGILTLAILILSEIIPKTLGAAYWRRLSPVCGYVIRTMIWITFPVVLLLEAISRKLASRRAAQKVLSRDELVVLAEIGESEGTLHRKEAQIIKNLIRLIQVTAEDVMTPRSVVLAFPKEVTVEDALREHPVIRFTRIPVFEKGLDDVTGYVLRHQIYQEVADGHPERRLEEIVKPIHAVPHSKTLDGVLEEMVRMREHIFLVVDEYGGTAGLVTLEDVIETLLSVEIVDELDPVADMRKLALEKWAARRKEMNF
jgi:CBS domain containing-hemolysin-like protein